MTRFDEDMKNFYSGRQDVPAHVRLHVAERMYAREQAESNLWIGVMVVCSFVCMLVLAWASWFFFGWAALGVLAGMYYFMTTCAAVSALLIRRVST